MNNAIKLVENIIKGMGYIKLLLNDGHRYVVPLHTFNRVMGQLEELRGMLDNEFLSEEQIRKAIKILEKPLKREKPYYVKVENPIEGGDPFKYNSLYRDSVGTEEIKEDIPCLGIYQHVP